MPRYSFVGDFVRRPRTSPATRATRSDARRETGVGGLQDISAAYRIDRGHARRASTAPSPLGFFWTVAAPWPRAGSNRHQRVTGRPGPVTQPGGSGSSRRANAPCSPPGRAWTGSHRSVPRPPAPSPARLGRTAPARASTPGSAHTAVAANRLPNEDELRKGDVTSSPREARVPVETWGKHNNGAGPLGPIGCVWILRAASYSFPHGTPARVASGEGCRESGSG